MAARAGEVADQVGATGRGAQELLDLYRPAAERGAPLLRRFVDEFSEEEMTALVRLVDQVPRFTEHMQSDIMPILATLDRVGPDVHELLDVLKDVRLAIQGDAGVRAVPPPGRRQGGRARRRAARDAARPRLTGPSAITDGRRRAPASHGRG